MKYRIYLLVIMCLLNLTPLLAQINMDPTHEVYEDIYRWENMGYLENIPSFKPYPLPVLKSLLTRVSEVGSQSEVDLAKDYLLECENRIGLYLSESFTLVNDEYGSISSVMLRGSGSLSKLISVGIFGGSYATLDEEFNTNPMYINRSMDYNTDVSNLGPFQLLSSFNAITAIGTDKMWLQGGLTRSSFGPFMDDNIFLSPHAPQTGYFNFNWYIRDNLYFTKNFYQLVATTTTGLNRSPEKFLSSHGLQFQALPWLNLGIYESLLFGGRFDLLYLIPLNQLMYSQGTNGFIDNYLIGVTGEVELPKNINVKGIFFVDDFHFNNALKLNFDSKYKFGFEARANWAPEHKLFKQIEIGYTLLTPHMYTHEPDGEREENRTIDYDYTERHEGNINYYNYTTQGVSLGSGMSPNSDKVSLTSKFKLPFSIDLDIFAKFIRTGNSSSELPEEAYGYSIVWLNDNEYFIDLNGNGERDEYYVSIDEDGNTTYYDSDDERPEDAEEVAGEEPLYLGDGSINDHGVIAIDRFGKYQNHWWYLWNDEFPLLSQNLDYIVQTGLSLSRSWKLKRFDLTTSLNYTYQNYKGISDNYINAGVELYF